MELRITIDNKEVYDEETNTFHYLDKTELVLVHSLKSLSRWESIYKEPFMQKFGDNRMTSSETIEYIKCMIVEPKNYEPDILMGLSNRDLNRISSYINDPMTATTFNEKSLKRVTGPSFNKEIITSEIIYYWMTALNIPFECENWNLNRLLALIRVCSIKNSPGKKMSQKEIMASNKALNAQRRAKLGSKG